MLCFHSRYTLGDEDKDYDFNDYDSWEEMKQAIIKDGAKVILPIYLYDHSGQTINTTGFSCGWDSGQIGFIYATDKMILENFGKKKVTKKLIEKTKEILLAEVETYDQYIRGDVYGFKLIDKKTDNEIDSCWGFYGDDIKTNGIMDHVDEENLVEVENAMV
jgi:hypothetical protein